MLDKHQVKAKTQELIVLFIEDNTSARRDMRAILDFYFYKVDVASDGKEGLEAYKKFYEKENFYYDLVITDLELPKLKGLELIKEIQKINPEQHIMISSAYNDYENLTNAINLGVDGFLQKPFNQKKFLEIMVNVANHINAADEEKFQKAKLEKLIDAKTREVQEQAKIDSFTLIPNFNALIEDINRSGEKALLVLDIDRFEDVNTTYGMEFGNSVLQRVAILLQDLVPENGRLYRIGSDEFGMLIIDPIENQLENLAETVSSFFRTYQIGINDVEIGLKFFMGISYEEHDFISGGRVAVKEAKLQKGKSYKIYNPNSAYAKSQKENLYKVQILKKLLELDKVVPYFHPIVDCKTKEIIKYETLVRLEGENGNIHSPAYFLEAAKLTGLLTAITKSMISKSFKIASEQNIDISINITEQDLHEEYLVGYLENRVRKFNLTPSRVTLEILENIAVNDNNTVASQIEELRKAGFIVALDDFGSENSSFSRILDINPDVIKIDGAFIRNLKNCEKSSKIVKSIIFLAKEIDAKIVAEFVADEETLLLITELGVDYAQGYIFGEPKKLSPTK